MNQQRLVAAIAALAVGFAITLVGVGVADDEIAVDSMEAEQEAGELDGGEEEFDDDQRAEQDEEVADEPEAAEAEEPSPPATESSTQQGQPAPAPTSAPVPTNAPNTSSAPDGNQGESGSDRPFPNDGTECTPVLRLEYTDGTEFNLLISDLGDDRFLILRRSGEDVIDIAVEEGLEDAFIEARVVEFQGGRAITIAELCDFEDGAPGGDLGDDVAAEAAPGEDFPCSDLAFEGLVRPLSTLERTGIFDHRDAFVISIARVLEDVGGTSEAIWLPLLEDEFESFVVLPGGCSQEIESGFVGSVSEFFCAAANVSADIDLFLFFQDQVGQAMAGCTFEDESAQGGT